MSYKKSNSFQRLLPTKAYKLIKKYKITFVEYIWRFLVCYMYISRSKLSSVALESKQRESKIQNIAKETLKSKQIEIGSQIQWQVQVNEKSS